MNPVILPAPRYRYNGRESLAGRVTVVWEPSPNFTSKFKATFASYDEDGPTQGAEALCFTPSPLNNGVPDAYQDCKLNGITALTDVPSLYSKLPSGLEAALRPGYMIDNRWDSGIPFTDSSSMLLTWENTLDLGSFRILSITGHSTLNYISRGNFNYSVYAQNAGGSDEDFGAWSEELRVISDLEGPFNFTFGGFWEKKTLWGSSTLRIAALPPDPTTGSYLSGVNESYEKQKTWSLFGQGRFAFNDQLEFAAGARYTKVKEQARQGQPNFVHDFLEGVLLPEGVLFEDRLNEDNWSPEATLTWQPNPDTTLYAAFKTGYKTGGIAQPALVTPGNTVRVFNPEKVRGGEIGYKGYLADRRVRLTATAFYYKFKGLQLTAFDPTISAYRISNAADVKQTGVEVEADVKITDGFSVRGSAAYIRNKYGSFLGSSCYANQTINDGAAYDFDNDGDPNTIGNGNSGDRCNAQDLTGEQIHRSPKFVASLGFSYDTMISGPLRLGINGDMRYRSSTLVQPDFNPASRQGAYALFHANVRLYDEDAGWELALIGRNLTNEYVIGYSNSRPGATTLGFPEASTYTIRPREIAVQGSLKF